MIDELDEWEKLSKQLEQHLLDLNKIIVKSKYDWGIALSLDNISKKLNKTKTLTTLQKRIQEIEHFNYQKNKAKIDKKNKTTFKLASIQFNKAVKMLKDVKKWTGEPDMLGLVIGDVSDHIKLACALAENDKKKIDKCTDMDTASREEIPMTVWNWIERQWYSGRNF